KKSADACEASTRARAQGTPRAQVSQKGRGCRPTRGRRHCARRRGWRWPYSRWASRSSSERVDSVSPAHADQGGLPRGHARALTGSRTAVEEDLRGANEAKTHKLRRNELTRRARSQGLELRHSAYGYALIDRARTPVEGRNDLTLDEVEARLGPP